MAMNSGEEWLIVAKDMIHDAEITGVFLEFWPEIPVVNTETVPCIVYV